MAASVPAAPPSASAAAAAADDDDDDEPAVFDSTHYPRGPNGDFLTPTDGLDLIEKYAGGKAGGGGKFEDAEKRDIAAGIGGIVRMLHGVSVGGAVAEDATILDVGAGTGLLLRHLAALVPDGRLLNSEISPDFRSWLGARIATEGLGGRAEVVASTARDPAPGLAPASVDLALMVDVYHHVEWPRAVCRRLRSLLRPSGRLVVIDFFRDVAKITSHPPEWVMNHLRAGQVRPKGSELMIFLKHFFAAGWGYHLTPGHSPALRVSRGLRRRCFDRRSWRAASRSWTSRPSPSCARTT